MRTRKLVFVRNLQRSNCLSIQVCTKMQIALVPIQRIIKFIVGPCDFAPKHFNLVPSFTGYEIAQRLFFFLMLFDFRLFFGLAFLINNPITRGFHYNCIRCYIPLHCVTSGQQSCFWDFRPTRSVYSPFLAYRPSQYLARV